MRRVQVGYWENPEWIYDQAQKIDKYVKTPEMVALKTRSLAVFQQHMAGRFPEMFQYYTKIFFRAINQQLNGPMFLMLLKQKAKMDNGEIPWDEGNQEVIGASFQLLLRKLPENLQGKILNTYKDLVEEEKKEMREAIREKLKEQGETIDDENVQSMIDSATKAQQRIEVVENETQN